MYDYGARWYNARIGRFIGVDPLADKYPEWIPYHYVHNNPVRLVDPTGMSADTNRVFVFDTNIRPSDNGTPGTSYTADIYVLDDETGDLNGPYSGSSYPNSISNTNNSTAYNTLDEGEHRFNNQSGHRGGTRQGLNIVDKNGNRIAPGTNPNGNSIQMQYVNVHEGQSNRGNYNSRGSHGCITIDPNVSQNFFNNFNFSNGNTGNETGTINVQRLGPISRTREVNDLQERALLIRLGVPGF